MKRVILLLSIILFLTSCTTIYKTINGVNKIKAFESREEYANYFNSKYDLEKEKIYFLPKNEIGSFFRYISENKVSYFYGITLNDSLKINDPFLNENNSCSGRISDIIHAQKKEYNTIPTKLATFSFENVNQEKLDISKGKSVIFLISTQLGRSNNKTIKELSEEVHSLDNPDINYYFLSVDNSYIGD